MKEPMLAATCKDVNTISYPIFASPKLDGVRVLVMGGQLVSRSFLPIKNQYVQNMFKGLPDGADGEMIVGSPVAKDASGQSVVFRTTSSAISRSSGEPENVSYNIFDKWNADGTFTSRFQRATNQYREHPNVEIVPHTLIHNAAELLAFEEKMLDLGYEGVMIRSLGGPYKEGRSTAKQGYLLKLKQFLDAEAVIFDSYEMMHNENEAEQSLTGHTERSTKKEGMVPAGILGGFEVRGLNGAFEGIEFDIGGGFTMNDVKQKKPVEFSRDWLWKRRKSLPGLIAKYRYFPQGGRDKPRFGVFIGFRDKIDL